MRCRRVVSLPSHSQTRTHTHTHIYNALVKICEMWKNSTASVFHNLHSQGRNLHVDAKIPANQ
jgi:hypothetical protein